MNEPRTDFPIELTEDEYRQLIFVLGYCAAAAREKQHPDIVAMVYGSTNAVSRHNPRWQPFQEVKECETPRVKN